jgi:mRNA interferase MazF
MPAGRVGREQFGTRPGIVVQADAADPQLPTTVIIPATSRLEAQRFPYTLTIQPSVLNGLDRPSVFLVFQARAIDKRRLIRRLGRLEDDELKSPETKVRALLAI